MKITKTVIFLCILLLGTILCSLEISTPVHADPTATPWLSLRHDLNNTGFTSSLAPNTSAVVWTFNKTVDNRIGYPVTVAGDKVFVGGYGNRMEALNEQTGAIIWNVTLPAHAPFPTPVVDTAKGLVIFGTFGANVTALNVNTGETVWNVQPFSDPSGPQYFGWHLPAAQIDSAKGLVFIGSFQPGGRGYMYALNETNGAIVWWKGPFGQGVTNTVVFHNGKLFFGDAGAPAPANNGTVWALNETDGSTIWHYTTGYSIASTAAYSSGKIYIGSNDGYLYCFDENTGAQVWNYSAGRHPKGNTGVAASPAIDEAKGWVICASDQGYLFALDKNTGTEVWKVVFPGGVQGSITPGNPAGFIPGSSSPAITSDGVIFISGINNSYVGYGSEQLLAYNETNGLLLWSYITGVGKREPKNPDSTYPLSSPIVADEHVFIGSYNWTVYCIGQPFAVTSYKLTVRVVDQAGSAVAGANVTVSSSQALTNSTGHAVFNLPAGSYTVTVSKDGYDSTSQTVSVSADSETSITLNKPTEFPYLIIIIAIVVIIIVVVAVVVVLKMRKPASAQPQTPAPTPETPKT